MKLLTLNTHSWLENDQINKIDQLVIKICHEKYDIIALQEVNQPLTKQVHKAATPIITNTNYLTILIDKLAKEGLYYDYRWVATHQSYGRFDEGIAIISAHPIEETHEVLLSPSLAYDNYQRRKALGIKLSLKDNDLWFYTIHFSWWDTNFKTEWRALLAALNSYEKRQIFLLGDFNTPSQIKEQGYDLVCEDKWYDTFLLAKDVIGDATVLKKIDGWEDNQEAIRIDFIFSSQKIPIVLSKVVFDNYNGPIISDHYGLEVLI